MNSLKYLNVVLTVLAVLLGLQVWTTWTQSTDMVAPAAAQGIPDEGAQRKQIVDELKLLVKKVETTNDLLASGKVRVIVVGEVEDDRKTR
jgi:surface antigen